MNLDDYEAKPSAVLYAPWPWTPEYPNIKELEQRIEDRVKEKKKKKN